MSLELLFGAPHLMVTGGLLAFLLILFIVMYLLRGVLLRLTYGRIIRQLKKAEVHSSKELQQLFERDDKLAHLWNEYRETLHEQKVFRDGAQEILTLRSTVPAEAFFNSQYLIDNRLRTEFFKHLPGIFTGIGIIGTFFGLIIGLQRFQVSEDAGQVRQSLELLLHGVYEAFFVSAAAITIAILVTLLEKLLVASLYRCAEDIAQELDRQFVSGAGEEYLSRLVTASEDSASQAKLLKDSLIGDLKAILQNLTDKQINAYAASNTSLGDQLTNSIATSLKDPLNEIKNLVKTASAEQSTAATEMLKDVMASFSQRLNDLFGGQIAGIQELNQQTAQSMQEAVSSLNRLLGNMELASQRAGDTMAEKMEAAVEAMERRQAEATTKMMEYIGQLQQTTATTQIETGDRVQKLLGELGGQVSSVVELLHQQSSQAREDQQEREQRFAAQAEGMVTTLGDSVTEVVTQMAQSTDAMRQSIAALERSTSGTVDKMQASAGTLAQAATDFAQAGAKVTEVLSRADGVSSKLAEMAGAMTTSAASLKEVIGDYRANRDATAALLAEVKAVVEAAKREASITQAALDQIQTASVALGGAQREAEGYLDGISKVLADAHQSFADGLVHTLDRANIEFHNKISAAVKLLSSAIEELSITISEFEPVGD